MTEASTSKAKTPAAKTLSLKSGAGAFISVSRPPLRHALDPERLAWIPPEGDALGYRNSRCKAAEWAGIPLWARLDWHCRCKQVPGRRKVQLYQGRKARF